MWFVSIFQEYTVVCIYELQQESVHSQEISVYWVCQNKTNQLWLIMQAMIA